jgi:hypothetical protein
VKFTNKHNLPGAFFRAVVNDPYDRQGTWSPSLLNSPARQTALIEQHFETLEIDVSSRFAATLGQGVHTILERGAREGIDICEQRFYAHIEVDGQKELVSAQIDLYEGDSFTLYDWKTTKAWAFSKQYGGGVKEDWTSQLNVARWVMSKQASPILVKKLVIVGWLKNWDEREAEKKPASYPRTEMLTAEQPLWSFDKTEAWISERIRAIKAAKQVLPLCSLKETWGGKRCASFCDAAAKCSQYQNALKTGKLGGE